MKPKPVSIASPDLWVRSRLARPLLVLCQPSAACRSTASGWRIALSMTAAVLALCTGPALAQESITLKVSTFQPEQGNFTTTFRKWADEVTRRTNGRVKFQYFYSGALLNTADTAPGVRDGRADIGFTGAVYEPARLTLSTVDSIPFLTNNVAALGQAYWETYKASLEMQKEYDDANFKLLVYQPASMNLIFSKKPLAGLNDLKGLRLRTIGLAVEALKAVGVSPIAIPQDQALDSLQKGLLDGTFGAGLDLGVDFGFHTAAPYIVDPNYGVWASGMHIMNKNAYDKLAPDIRAVMTSVSDEFMSKHYLPDLQRTEDLRCEKAKKDGAKFSAWPQAELDKWRASTGDTGRQRWLATAKAKGHDAEKFLTLLESRIKEAEKTMTWTSAVRRCMAKS